MKGKLYLSLLICFTSLYSCIDRRNISVNGQIIDELTGQPIPNAEVVVLCWYMSSIDDASFEKQTLKTDVYGRYSAFFNKGHKVGVASKSKGFNPARSYNKLKTKGIIINLNLQREENNPTLKTIFGYDHYEFEPTDKTPFLRARIHAYDSSVKLNFQNVETFGFDFQTFTMTNDTTQCDIWFKPVDKEEQPTIMRAGSKGGIMPVHSNVISSSFYFEKPYAPTNGYLAEHKLKGNEEGCFVLCRDGKTYGKIIFQNEVSRGGADNLGNYYLDIGKKFSCLYQPNGTTNLSFTESNIDLEDFLVNQGYR